MRTTTLCSMSAAPSFVIAHILPPQNTIVNIFLSFFDKSKGKRNLRTGESGDASLQKPLSLSLTSARGATLTVPITEITVSVPLLSLLLLRGPICTGSYNQSPPPRRGEGAVIPPVPRHSAAAPSAAAASPASAGPSARKSPARGPGGQSGPAHGGPHSPAGSPGSGPGRCSG